MGRPSYAHNAGYYRSVDPDDDLSQPWQSTPFSDHELPLSPLRPVFDIPRVTPESPITSSSSTPTISLIRVPVPGRKKGFWARIRKFFQTGTFSLDEEIVISIPSGNASKSNTFQSSKVELHEWKQYGYWARPMLHDVMAINSPVTSEKSITTQDLKSRIQNLRGPNHSPHPETWVPGVKHRALPPRPSRWKDPVPNEPLPFPWEVQINPLLQHSLWGPSPLSWCLSDNPLSPTALRYGCTPFIVDCEPPDFAQPATYPFLTHMHFNAVAGDTAPTFPWPFTVYNPRGIQNGDILTEIWKTFQVPVTRDEQMSWPPLRQQAAARALKERCQMESYRRMERFDDVMRRCDALGGIMWFRGIEPTINGGGWMITFGTH
ncbi:hypothetical protein CPB84DRAFT_1785459 [Gymnopilus junonius]|uniref:DUF6699 domain-containing protein n=1 Tax=Gymnopilus junonius TaxID=109634 RepID=A0A9P5NJ29_GYMJU|nr:hypothetical protein CPB84DRAFT_1785459 [Gymnopilus junonius]